MPLTLAKPLSSAAIARLAATSGTPKADIALAAQRSAAPAISNKQQRIAANRAIVDSVYTTLNAAHPFLFGGRAKPLEIGIFAALAARHPDLDPQHLRLFLASWTRSRRYAFAIKHNASRFDIDGQPVAAVDPDLRKGSVDEIMTRQRTRK
jgi:hypothetical protein